MFVMTRDGLVNIVANRDKPGGYVLKARDTQSFSGYFAPEKILKRNQSDYAYHVMLDSQDELNSFFDHLGTLTNYDSFSSVLKSQKLQALYGAIYKVWFVVSKMSV